MMRRSTLFSSAISLALISLMLSLSKGSTSTPFDQLLFLELRLPRTLTAFVTGSLLALAGSLIQLLLQNPLADPYVLGISGGAALATLLLMLLGVGEIGLMGGAWLGSLLTIFLIFLLARRHHWKTHSLLLCGIALACGYSACISLVLLLAPGENLRSMLFWLAGDLNDARIPWSGILVLALGFPTCMLLAPGLNILGRGEREARTLGLASEKYRIALYVLSSLFTATAVTLSGCLGFIGLIIPHLTRKLTGHDFRLALPMNLLLGGGFLTLTDTLARALFAPQQLPVGMLMALLGVPIFIWLLQR